MKRALYETNLFKKYRNEQDQRRNQALSFGFMLGSLTSLVAIGIIIGLLVYFEYIGIVLN